MPKERLPIHLSDSIVSLKDFNLLVTEKEFLSNEEYRIILANELYRALQSEIKELSEFVTSCRK